MHVDLDPTIHHASSNEHGEASATRINQDMRSNEVQGHSHEDGVNNMQAQTLPQLNNEERSEVNPPQCNTPGVKHALTSANHEHKHPHACHFM